ncbi:hypothetical protein UlMin_045808, partial [Ulmus minor]
MQQEEKVSRSPLDKPLHLLTEDDISQLTREDCRRYLKEKGMRRPSWNKSQAIQQVISLKALLETTPDSNSDGAPMRLHIPHPGNHSPGHSDSDAPDTRALAMADESVTNQPCDSPKLDVPGDISGQIAPAGNNSVSIRTVEVTNEPVGQMTIFHRGKVNVFDDVSGDKARILMELAASPLLLPHAAPSEVITTLWPFQCHFQAAEIKLGPTSPPVIFPRLQTASEKGQFLRDSNKSLEDPGVGPTSRKALVQRYLEKRKDRFKHKRKVAVPSSYLNHVVGDHIPNQHLNQSDALSPSQLRPPQTPTKSSSVENIMKRSGGQAKCNEK